MVPNSTNMEAVKLIVNPKIYIQTCFLCFKQHEELSSIHSDLIIIKDQQEYTVTVFKMVSHLFSMTDTILHQVCDKCSEIVISVYILIQNHSLMKQNLMKISRSLEQDILDIKQFDEKCYLKLQPQQKISVNEVKKSILKVAGCVQCNMTFESKKQLQEHRKMTHKNTNEALICHICGKSCKSLNALRAHSNCHKEKQCPYCFKMLKTHSHYRNHVNSHLSYSKRKLNNTKYNCHSCSFVSLSKSTVDAHMNKIHLDIRPYICHICSKGFYKKSNLTEHIRIHDKVKNETCEICGDSFVCKKTLMEHIRLHKNLKPYKCEMCSECFVTSGRRSDHFKRKHMEKTECCMICNKMFSLKKTLNRHMKKMHWQQCNAIHVPEFVETVDAGNLEMLLPIS